MLSKLLERRGALAPLVASLALVSGRRARLRFASWLQDDARRRVVVSSEPAAVRRSVATATTRRDPDRTAVGLSRVA